MGIVFTKQYNEEQEKLREKVKELNNKIETVLVRMDALRQEWDNYCDEDYNETYTLVDTSRDDSIS